MRLPGRTRFDGATARQSRQLAGTRARARPGSQGHAHENVASRRQKISVFISVSATSPVFSCDPPQSQVKCGASSVVQTSGPKLWKTGGKKAFWLGDIDGAPKLPPSPPNP